MQALILAAALSTAPAPEVFPIPSTLYAMRWEKPAAENCVRVDTKKTFARIHNDLIAHPKRDTSIRGGKEGDTIVLVVLHLDFDTDKLPPYPSNEVFVSDKKYCQGYYSWYWGEALQLRQTLRLHKRPGWKDLTDSLIGGSRSSKFKR